MAYDDYNNALNKEYDRHNIQNPKTTSFKYLLRFKADNAEVIEIKEMEYCDKHSCKFYVNGRDGVKLLLGYNGENFRQAHESYGVYATEDDLVKDVLVWYKKKQKLMTKYKHSYDTVRSTLNNVQGFFSGREEFLI